MVSDNKTEHLCFFDCWLNKSNLKKLTQALGNSDHIFHNLTDLFGFDFIKILDKKKWID